MAYRAYPRFILMFIVFMLLFYVITLLIRHIASQEELSHAVNKIINDKMDGTKPLGASTPTCVPAQAGRVVNKLVVDHLDYRARFRKLIARNVTAHDPALIKLIREMMDPPSSHILKAVRRVDSTPQSKAVVKILKDKKHGFFIEAGALDGERSSNTLHLEMSLGWTGLLVEMDPYFYTQLIGKTRRAWSINACISPYKYPTEVDFKEHGGGAGKIVQEDDGKHRLRVPCFPLESLLAALNRTHVDYVSLDVEGVETDILVTIPFNTLDISVMSVEYIHLKTNKEDLKTFMENNGFVTHEDINSQKRGLSEFVYDYIFVKPDILKPEV